MPPFRVARKPVKQFGQGAVTPFGQGVDGVVGQVDAANHRNKFGKPPMPKGAKFPKPNFRP
jgi:hypothetical protein